MLENNNEFDDGRSRPIQKKFWVDDAEDSYIKKRMAEAGIKNFGHFARELLIKGEIKLIDFSAIKQLRLEVNRIGVNINQTVKIIHENGGATADQVEQLLAYQKNLEQQVNQVIKSNIKTSQRKETNDGRDQGFSD